ERREVVAVEGDVEGPDRQPDTLVGVDLLGQPAREGNAAALDSDEAEAVRAGLLLDDLVGDANDRPADLVRGHDAAARHRSSWPLGPVPASRRSAGSPESPAHGPARRFGPESSRSRRT